jgi:hypothetical protein
MLVLTLEFLQFMYRWWIHHFLSLGCFSSWFLFLSALGSFLYTLVLYLFQFLVNFAVVIYILMQSVLFFHSCSIHFALFEGHLLASHLGHCDYVGLHILA